MSNTKTKVELTKTPNECVFSMGMCGYIDGYVRGFDNKPYAVVVCRSRIDMVPLYALKVLKPTL